MWFTRLFQCYEDLSTDTDFIVGMSDVVLESQRIFQRYEELESITVKRLFEDTYSGFSVHVRKDSFKAFLDQINLDTDIKWVEPDPTIKQESNSPSMSYDDGKHLPWGVDQIDAKLFSDVALDNGSTLSDYTNRVHVFVLDSGIESPDISVCETRSFVDEDVADDATGHGSHIAGTIGAKKNGESVLGIAPNACPHGYKVMTENGKTVLSSVVDAVDRITALKQAHPNRPMVVNISLGVDIVSLWNTMDKDKTLTQQSGTSMDAGIAWITPDLELESEPTSIEPFAGSGETTPWGVERISATTSAEAQSVEVYVSTPACKPRTCRCRKA